MGDSSELQGSEFQKPSANEKPQPDWMSQVDRELAFRLVDSILPFEACLYHQILPLSLEGSRLKLGMVDPDDTAALDYVRRILAYMNCSLVPQPIASDVHYAALSAYLSYADQQKQVTSASSQPVARRIAKKLAEHSAKRGGDRKPESLPSNRAADSANSTLGQEPRSAADEPTIAELPPETVTDQPKLLIINPQYLTDSTEMLAHLPPSQLLEELLGRILSWGIGRLYLERKVEQGRILWSQNGILQAVLEELPLETFAGVIQELKHLTQFPLETVQKPKQVERDRVYQDERLLLRLRLMPGRYGGEEATLQILRGVALRFYRQQQLVNLGQEALGIAQQLQNKVGEVYTYSHSHGVPLPEHLSIVPELDRTLKRVAYQLNELQNLRFQDITDDE